MRLWSRQGPGCEGPGHEELSLHCEGHGEPLKCLNTRRHCKNRQWQADSAMEEARLEVGRSMARFLEGEMIRFGPRWQLERRDRVQGEWPWHLGVQRCHLVQRGLWVVKLWGRD